MGASPWSHRGDTVPTPASLAKGLGVAGGHKKLHSRFVGAVEKRHRLKNGQRAEFQSSGYPLYEQASVFVECSTKA